MIVQDLKRMKEMGRLRESEMGAFAKIISNPVLVVLYLNLKPKRERHYCNMSVLAVPSAGG
jgi:hypothetical protein